MAETYDGTEGDDALAAGLPIMDGEEDWRDGWKSINRTRDLIAQLKTWVTSQIASISLTWSAISGKPSTFPPSSHTHDDRYYTRTFMDGVVDTLQTNANGRVSKSGDTMSGPLYLPTSFAASSGFTVAYINGDGRVSRGASSEKYKKHISTIDPMSLGNIFPDFNRFQMRADGIMPADNSWRYGYIAERLVGTDAEPFVVFINNEVESIDFIGLMLAQIAQLNARVTALEAAQ